MEIAIDDVLRGRGNLPSALPSRVQSSYTAARLDANEAVGRPALPTMLFLVFG